MLTQLEMNIKSVRFKNVKSLHFFSVEHLTLYKHEKCIKIYTKIYKYAS